MTKWRCTNIPVEYFRLKGVIPDWDMHPSWITAIESLDSFGLWVSEVVLPIAFQWIYEHREEVYKNLSRDNPNFDDVGVVIAEAFKIVREKEYYKKGLACFREDFVPAVKGEWAQGHDESKEKFDINRMNPVWAKITRTIREEVRAAFDAEKDVLDDTIR